MKEKNRVFFFTITNTDMNGVSCNLILIIFLGARSRVKCSRVPQSGRGAQGRQLLYCPLQRWGRQDWDFYWGVQTRGGVL